MKRRHEMSPLFFCLLNLNDSCYQPLGFTWNIKSGLDAAGLITRTHHLHRQPVGDQGGFVLAFDLDR